MIGETISGGGGRQIYRCAPAISWLQDADQILLVDVEEGHTWSLRGVEAALWDFLTLAYSYEKIVRFLSLLLRVSTDEAERTLLTILHAWQKAGIVQAVGEEDRGESCG